MGLMALHAAVLRKTVLRVRAGLKRSALTFNVKYLLLKRALT